MVLPPCFKREALKEEDIAIIHKEYIFIYDKRIIYIYIQKYFMCNNKGNYNHGK